MPPPIRENELMTVTDPDIIPAVAEDTADKGAAFTTLMTVANHETSDGRIFDAFDWRDLPIPFMVQDTTAHGPGQTPEPAWAAGQIDSMGPHPQNPNVVMGRGHLMPGETGARAEQLARNAFRGVSIDGYGDPPTVEA